MEDTIIVNDFTIQYGVTTTQELIRQGYTVANLEQIIEEPTITSCKLVKKNKIVARLYYYDIKEYIEIEQLLIEPIDFVLIERKPQTLYKKNSYSQILKYTILIHLFSAMLFLLVYLIPPLLTFVENSGNSQGYPKMGFGMILLILPALIITFISSGNVVGTKGNMIKKLVLSLWFIVNVCISLTYLVLIHLNFS